MVRAITMVSALIRFPTTEARDWQTYNISVTTNTGTSSQYQTVLRSPCRNSPCRKLRKTDQINLQYC